MPEMESIINGSLSLLSLGPLVGLAHSFVALPLQPVFNVVHFLLTAFALRNEPGEAASLMSCWVPEVGWIPRPGQVVCSAKIACINRPVCNSKQRGVLFHQRGVLFSIKWVWLTYVPYKFMCIEQLKRGVLPNPPAYGPD